MSYADPDEQRSAERRSKRRARTAIGGEPGASRARGVVQPDVRSLDGIIDTLQAALADVMDDESAGALSRGRVVAQLTGQALKAYEVGVLSDRLEAVEAALHVRRQTRR